MTEIRSQRLAARHIRRIEVELRDLERSEALQQRAYGDRRAGTVRSSNWRLAEALRAVLEIHRPREGLR